MKKSLKRLARNAWIYLNDSGERQDRIPLIAYPFALAAALALVMGMSVGAAYGF